MYRSAGKKFHSICPDGISYWLYRTLVTWNVEERKYLDLYSRWSLTVAINKDIAKSNGVESSSDGLVPSYHDTESIYTQVIKCPRQNCQCTWLHSRPFYNRKVKNEHNRFFHSSPSFKNETNARYTHGSLSSSILLRASGWFYNAIDEQVEEELTQSYGYTTDHWVSAQDIPSKSINNRRLKALDEKDGRYSCCPHCKHEFCGLCLLPWTARAPSMKKRKQLSHFSMMCSLYRNEIANVSPEDEEYFSIAQAIDAKCCPKCSLRTERTHGCNHMVCPCGMHWCYICEERWHNNHYTCHEGQRCQQSQRFRESCIMM